MVDTSDGKPFDFVTLPVEQMAMTLSPFDQPLPLVNILPLRVAGSSTLPDQLATLPALPAQSQLDTLNKRTLKLSMDKQLDELGMAALMKRYGQKSMPGMHDSAMSGMAMNNSRCPQKGCR